MTPVLRGMRRLRGYMNRYGNQRLLDHVQVVRQGTPHPVCLRRSMDGSAHQVCARVLHYAALARAPVRTQA